MKKWTLWVLLIFMALSLLAGVASAAAQASAETSTQAVTEDEESRVYNNAMAGIRFPMPKAWIPGIDIKENIVITDFDDGTIFTFYSSVAMEKIKILMESAEANPDAEEMTPEQESLLEEILANQVPFFAILALQADANEEETAIYTEMVEYLQNDFADQKSIGEANGDKYTMLYNEEVDMSSLPEADKAELTANIAAMEEMLAGIVLSGVKGMEDIVDADLTFASETLTGAPMDSGVFAEAKLTLVNVWATWCGPCINEMPELQKLYGALPEGVNLISICIDALEDPEMAAKVVETTGIQYPVVVANEEMENGFLAFISAIPTTLFVDSKGQMVGEPTVGAPSDVVKQYTEKIEALLKTIE